MKTFFLLMSFLFLGSTPKLSRAGIPDGTLERHILDRLLDEKYYDPEARPNGTVDGANVVKLQMYVLDISSVDDTKMEFTATMYLRQIWNDSRLVFDDADGLISNLTLSDVHRIWRPDLFFTNARDGKFHDLTTPNTFANIKPTGELRYSLKLTVTFSCPMNLAYYPLDVHTCPILIESYGRNSKGILLRWSEEYTAEVGDSVKIPGFTVENVVSRDCSKTFQLGEYSCLRVDITLSRNIGFHLKKVYVPYFSLILLAWVSFWLDSSLMYIRAALLLVLLMMSYSLTSDITNSVPPVSYTKAVDVWTGICLTFIIVALIEFLLVTIFRKNEEDREKDVPSVPIETGMVKEDTAEPQDGKKEAKKETKINLKLFQRYLKKYPSRSRRCDVASRILYPVLFAFFNLVYWCAYTCSQPEDLEVYK